jgi:hypothetical protein
MSRIGAIFIAVSLVILNGILGHYSAPYAFYASPPLCIFVAYLIVSKTVNLGFISKGIITYILVGLNDTILKLYSGGKHDSEGQMWANFFLYINVVVTLLVLLDWIYREKSENVSAKWIALFIFVTLISVHITLLSSLGFSNGNR